MNTDIGFAFWLSPDWSGGPNLRDPNTQPFWMLDPLPYQADPITLPKIEVAIPKTLKPKTLMQKARRLGFDTANWKPNLLCRTLGRHLSVNVCQGHDDGEYTVHVKCCNLVGSVFVQNQKARTGTYVAQTETGALHRLHL